MPRSRRRHPPAEAPAIRAAYQQHGVRAYYQQFGDQYRNSHEPAIRESLRLAVVRWDLDLRHVLDLACGSGEVTLALRDLGYAAVEGVDPYTAGAYAARTGMIAEPYTFEQIAAGALAGRRYSTIICSFALHLLEGSRLPALAAQLRLISDVLVILTPHKRPHLKPEWGWACQDELLVDRVRTRYYRATQ
jgi:SAM-dependent methyltransferase